LLQSQLVDGDARLGAPCQISEEDNVALGIRADQQAGAAVAKEQDNRSGVHSSP
jgi:hypothetical protein